VARTTNKKRQSGQAAVEFIVVVVVIFFFLFFFLSLAITLVISDYIEYATFMAARTYKSGYSSQAVQERNAQAVFNSYVGKIEGIARNFAPLEFVKADPDDEQTAGVRTSYEIDLFYLPPIFITEAIPGGRIRLNAQAHLGRDPAFDDCQNFFNEFSRRLGLGIEGTGFIGQMADNGC